MIQNGDNITIRRNLETRQLSERFSPIWYERMDDDPSNGGYIMDERDHRSED